MSVEIITPRRTVPHVERRREFEWKDCPGAGFSFDLDNNDEIIVTDGNRENVARCLKDGGATLYDNGINVIEWEHVEPAVGRCSCGREVTLDTSPAGNDCGCGRIYNSSGQELAPRSQWGEETGETYADIVQGGVDD
jgi:hypothetical protein